MGERIIAPLILLIGHGERQSSRGGKGGLDVCYSIRRDTGFSFCFISLRFAPAARRGVLPRCPEEFLGEQYYISTPPPCMYLVAGM